MNNIKAILEEKGISMNKMATDLDMRYPTVHDLVGRKSLDSTSLGRLREIADYLEVSVQKLYEGENKMLENLIKELEELKGEEFTLLEMDNAIQNILGTDAGSIFEGETESFVEDGQYSYTTRADEDKEDTVDINIHFEVLEENEVSMGVLVKIVDVEEL